MGPYGIVPFVPSPLLLNTKIKQWRDLASCFLQWQLAWSAPCLSTRGLQEVTFRTHPGAHRSRCTLAAEAQVRSSSSCSSQVAQLLSLACGKSASGFTAAINQLSFGSGPGSGAGDACGRCFALTGSKDPYSPSFTGPFHSIVVKVTDLCPVAGNEEWCGQTTSDPLNEHQEPVQ